MDSRRVRGNVAYVVGVVRRCVAGEERFDVRKDGPCDLSYLLTLTLGHSAWPLFEDGGEEAD